MLIIFVLLGMHRVINILRLLLLPLLFLVSFSFADKFNEKVLNGFNLSNSTIPTSKILSGGPPRDGIPSLDNPKFVSANQANFLTAPDRVLGIVINDEARAYPIKILNWHEIVNDVIRGIPIVITYCPLCGSGIVYHSRINGTNHTFGVSGLLYNSDVLLYDRQTKTLWSQILSKAISGSLVNTKINIIPSSHTNWQTWKKKHPKTKVLSTNTDYDRNYNRSPYGNYDKNRSLYFQVDAQSKKYHPKERVLGITINGKHKSYAFAELARHKQSPLHDTFAGKQLIISFDAQTAMV